MATSRSRSRSKHRAAYTYIRDGKVVHVKEKRSRNNDITIKAKVRRQEYDIDRKHRHKIASKLTGTSARSLHCQSGTIARSAYTKPSYTRAAYTRADGVKVKKARVGSTVVAARCIKATTKAAARTGKTWAERHPSMRGIGPIEKHRLGKFGYSASKPAAERRAALRKADAKYGKLSVARELQAIATYTKHTSPSKSAKFHRDAVWEYARHKSTKIIKSSK